MFFIYGILICLSPLYLYWLTMFLKKKKFSFLHGINDYINEIAFFQIFGIIISFFLLVLLVIKIPITNYRIKEREQKIITLEKKMEIFNDRKDVLYLQYSNMLDSNYKTYEKKLWDDMTKRELNVNIYPEIKYSQTIILLSTKLQELTDKIYDCQLNIEDHKRWISTVQYNPFLIRQFIYKSKYSN